MNWREMLPASLWSLIGLCLLPSLTGGQQEPFLTLRQGRLQGVKIYTDGRAAVWAFLGIPYAKPPVDSNRFLAPEVHPGWEGSLKAMSFKPACVQPLQELQPNFGASPAQDEDCLFLNVWTPEYQATGASRKAPVLVVLEGEGFVSSYPGRLPGQDLAAEGIVIVSISYRLNVFGFLCLERGDARGNLGLLDQYLALVWVRENIALFGGDPHSVTLLGHSAGAVSALYHMVSPRTNGLFDRAILMSGSILSPWSKSISPSSGSYQIARSLGCTGRPKNILNCLRNKSSSELLKAFETQYMHGNWSELPLPVVDDFLPGSEQYLPKEPLEVLRSGEFLNVPVLTGLTSHEGALIMSNWNDLVQQGFTQLKHLFGDSVIPSVSEKYNFTKSPSSQEILAILRGFYMDQAKDGDINDMINKMLNFYTDSQFKAPFQKQLLHLAISNNGERRLVYAYLFEQEVNHLYKHLNISGSGHGEDLLFLFGPSILNNIGKVRFTPAEERLSAIMKRFWIEFVRKGSISSSPFGYGVSWTPYSPSDKNYIIFRADNSLPATQSVVRAPIPTIAKDALAKQTVWLWNVLLPRLRDLRGSSNTIHRSTDPKEMQLTTDLPYRSAMYTLIAFVVILLVLLVVCIVLLKRRGGGVDRLERDMF